MNPTVSVVMPVYNSAGFLEEAIESILAQSFGDFELIAVNDGSTDICESILERYQRQDARVRVLHQQNSGISAARNNGVKHARGKYIAVMDSDDISLPNRLEKQVALMESRPNVGLCGSRCCFFGDNGEYAGVLPPADPDTVKCRLLFLPTLSNTSLMMRRELIVQEGLFYDESLAAAEDYDLSARFSHHCEITNLPDILMRIRVHAGSTTRRRADEGDMWLSRVHQSVLSRLGIQASEDELSVHLCAGTLGNCRTNTKAFVESVERWFLILTDANEKTSIYSSAALEMMLFERWCLVCLLCGEPIFWKLRRVRKSPFFLGDSHFLRYCISLGGKRMLKALRRRAARGEKK
ncbi:MAG: glycosyltransferase family 2 protein [Armatimonadota bacterium]